MNQSKNLQIENLQLELVKFREEISALKVKEDESEDLKNGKERSQAHFEGDFNAGELTEEDLEMWRVYKEVLAGKEWNDDLDRQLDNWKTTILSDVRNLSREKFCFFLSNKIGVVIMQQETDKRREGKRI